MFHIDSESEQEEVTVQFRSGSPRIHKQLEKPLTNLNDDGQIQITGGKWKTLQIGQYSKYIQSWNIKTGLNLADNLEPTILMQIQKIQFNCLRVLQLSGNNIESIDALISLCAPSLSELYLDENQIISVQPLRKCFFPNIENLSLTYNKIMNFDCLFQSNSPVLFTISIDYDDELQFQNSNSIWLFKLQTQCLEIAALQNKMRIKNLVVQECLGKRFSNMFIAD